MKRRKFLAFLGGAVASGPSAAKVVAEQASLESLRLGSIGIGSVVGGPVPASQDMFGESYERTNWAKEALKTLTGMSALERDRMRRRTHINSLDPNIAACRSMSLVAKIRLSKDLAFEREQREQKSYLEGVIAGWWS